jgi:hypothetical protein
LLPCWSAHASDAAHGTKTPRIRYKLIHKSHLSDIQSAIIAQCTEPTKPQSNRQVKPGQVTLGTRPSTGPGESTGLFYDLGEIHLYRKVPQERPQDAKECRTPAALRMLARPGISHSSSPSSALRVSSSTSHFFRMAKMVLEANPARINWRKTRAASFWLLGFCSRLRCR